MLLFLQFFITLRTLKVSYFVERPSMWSCLIFSCGWAEVIFWQEYRKVMLCPVQSIISEGSVGEIELNPKSPNPEIFSMEVV